MKIFQRFCQLASRARARVPVEASTLTITGLATGALFAFISLAEEVIEGDTRALDEWVLRSLRNPADLADPIGPWWLEAMMRDITSVGSTTILVLITLSAIGYLLIERKYSDALLVLGAIGGGTAVSTLLKSVFARPRPELVAHLVDVHTLSFPSGHAMLSAVTFLTLGALLAQIQEELRTKIYLMAIAVVMALLVGISRVYLGVHYPTDVLAGWSAGAAWAMLCWLMARWLKNRT